MESTNKNILPIIIVSLLCLTSCGYSGESAQERVRMRRIDSVRVVIDGILEHYETFPSLPIEIVLDQQARQQNDARLDSAICVIDSNIDNDEVYLSMQKAAIYSLKKDYISGLHILQAINDSLINPTYKYVLCKHFEGVIAQSNHQMSLRDSLIQNIIDTLQIVVPQDVIDDVMKTRNENLILCNVKCRCIELYYYYMGQIYGQDSIRVMLRERYHDPYGTFTQVIEPSSNDFMTSYNEFICPFADF